MASNFQKHQGHQNRRKMGLFQIEENLRDMTLNAADDSQLDLLLKWTLLDPPEKLE